MSATASRAMAAVRAGVGLTMLLRPQAVARLIDAPRDGRHPALRVLGLRHVVQAAVISADPTRTVVAAGLAVDAAHVGSCLLFAPMSRTWRGTVLREAVLETGIAAATWVAVRQPPAA